MDGGDDDGSRGQHVHHRRKYVGYTTCLLLIFVVSFLLSPTCWLWRRDNDEVDGGDDDSPRGQRVHRRRMYVGYTTCRFFLLLSLCCIPHAGGTMTRRMLVTMTGREDNITEESLLAVLPVCCFLGGFNLFVVSHMLAMVEGQRRGGWW